MVFHAIIDADNRSNISDYYGTKTLKNAHHNCTDSFSMTWTNREKTTFPVCHRLTGNIQWRCRWHGLGLGGNSI